MYKILANRRRMPATLSFALLLFMYFTTLQAQTGSQQWTWIKGSTTNNANGLYGTKGVAAYSNTPGARDVMAKWTDDNGNIWVFGGRGYAQSGGEGLLNDLWKWDGTNWTWIHGSAAANQPGSYGTKGVASAANIPGARRGAMAWKDNNGNFWLFGGSGYDQNGNSNVLNDLWKWDGTNWTWVSGSSQVNAVAAYGTKNVAAATNVPGAREYGASWTDNDGNLLLFGGDGFDAFGSYGYLNDLWKWDGTNWTWISGSSSLNQRAVYGTKNTTASGNLPGSRSYMMCWKDTSGNLLLFGGGGYATAGYGWMNDVWKWDGSNWTWISGSNVVDQPSVYGSQGVAAATNIPGSRYYGTVIRDANGNVFLFGGYGYSQNNGSGYLNDFWKWDGTNWTWMGGSKNVNQPGIYGSQLVAGSSNLPGGRLNSICWLDNNNNFWLFGGWGYAQSGNGLLNDLWGYNVSNALPAKISALNGYLTDNSIQLRWSAYNEVQVEAYEIEKSKNGIAFTKFNSVKAQNQAAAVYSTTDTTPFEDDNFYRLKIVDVDGSFQYSNTVRIHVKRKATPLTIWPNPTQAGSYIEVLHNGWTKPLTFRITDIEGRVVQTGILSSKKQSVKIQTSARGTFILQLEDGNFARFISQ
jgi:N-acetylneuraminic acid mutarotase